MGQFVWSSGLPLYTARCTHIAQRNPGSATKAAPHTWRPTTTHTTALLPTQCTHGHPARTLRTCRIRSASRRRVYNLKHIYIYIDKKQHQSTHIHTLTHTSNRCAVTHLAFWLAFWRRSCTLVWVQSSWRILVFVLEIRIIRMCWIGHLTEVVVICWSMVFHWRTTIEILPHTQ